MPRSFSLVLFVLMVSINQGPHSFSPFELKTFLKTFFTTLTTYYKKIAIFLRKLKRFTNVYNASYLNMNLLIRQKHQM